MQESPRTSSRTCSIVPMIVKAWRSEVASRNGSSRTRVVAPSRVRTSMSLACLSSDLGSSELLAQREKSIDESINEYHTFSMKTAISIPDDLFEQVEKLSKKRRSSRSEVFATAVKDLLEKESSESS